ncbi:hypothetical protein H7K33_09375 [Mycobacterium paraense]|uniref:hypothetical protein n=1 Tax=Mycobacterium paraense TaxID=767916 RepID=UPI000A16054D|nr:hypothetical protein [Mycobacterium paraense]MCV7442433.1 hypothetical protein [Mycobacterium paraense]ORW35540.1 hypothetical protein AWB89_03150 [Mycobacterium paraense]
MIALAFYLVALGVVGWAQWVRRGTWRMQWEAPTTGASLMLAISLVLIAPAADPVIGRALFLVTGRYHVDDLLGHIMAPAALASSTLAGLMRMPSMRDRIIPLLHWPFTLAVGAMVALFTRTSASHDPTPDMFQIPHDHHWIEAYFAVVWLLLLYLGALNAWVALRLRRDPRSRPVARAWLIGVGFGAGGMVGWALPWLHLTAWYDWGRLAMCAATTVFAIATARSWQRKLDPWRDLLKATRARI